MEKQKIYVVQLDWTNEDDEGVVTELFATREKAVEKFNAIVQEEKTLDWYWSKDAFDKDGKLDTENYELQTNIDDPNALELYWELKCKGNYYLRDTLQLLIKELN